MNKFMQAVEELEKIETTIITRKKFNTDEIRKMMEIGVLPEESGWELIDGEIIHPMTIGSKHAGIVNRLNQLLVILLGKSAVVAIQNPVHIDERNEPEPDIALLKPRDDFYTNSLPLPEDVLLLIEVSDSTVEFDREIKKSLYAKAEIAEFWLINLRENTIETYSQPKNGAYRLAQILEKGEAVKSHSIENLILEIEEILA
ncbi:MAG: Uma2 family endonuclease [Pyrinomonadaceae bacterium]